MGYIVPIGKPYIPCCRYETMEPKANEVVVILLLLLLLLEKPFILTMRCHKNIVNAGFTYLKKSIFFLSRLCRDNNLLSNLNLNNVCNGQNNNPRPDTIIVAIFVITNKVYTIEKLI